jgi:hypothetical protein
MRENWVGKLWRRDALRRHVIYDGTVNSEMDRATAGCPLVLASTDQLKTDQNGHKIQNDKMSWLSICRGTRTRWPQVGWVHRAIEPSHTRPDQLTSNTVATLPDASPPRPTTHRQQRNPPPPAPPRLPY